MADSEINAGSGMHVNSDHSPAEGSLKLKINTTHNTVVNSMNGDVTEIRSPTKNGMHSEMAQKEKSLKSLKEHRSSKENSSSDKHKKSKEHSSEKSGKHHHEKTNKDKSSSPSKHSSSSSNKEKDESKSHDKVVSSKEKDKVSRDKSHSSSSHHKSSKSDREHSSSSKKHSKDKHKSGSSHDSKVKSESKSHSSSPEKKHGEKKSHSDKSKSDHHKKEVQGDLSTKVKTETVEVTKESKTLDDDTPLANLQGSEIKMETINSDEPLAKQTIISESKPHIKKEPSSPVKRRIVEHSDDDKPLSKRVEKDKKPKKEEERKRKSNSHSVEPAKKKKKSVTSESASESPRKQKKKEEVAEVWKWWEEEKMDDGVKWKTLEHKGPLFAPEYEPLPTNVRFRYDGAVMKLSPAAEEVAGFYARMIDHDYSKMDVFNNNFFHDWRKVMTPEEKLKITDLKKCGFREMDMHFKQKSEERKNMSKAEKLAVKQKNEEIMEEYGYCRIDGHKEKIGNFRIEPPGLFRGRGQHPKMGKLKRRTVPEDILINCGKNTKIPEPPKGHKWKEIKHDNTVTWLVSWTENVQGQTKYVMLNPSSKLKGEKDWQKYETARNLKQHVDRIRNEYRNDLKSKQMVARQRAVALYFIDKLALRAGNEKDDDSADTVGCCSLRVEHINLHKELNGKENVVEFDFLGKDSIRYQNQVGVEKRVFKNLQLFCEGKKDGDDLFDRLNTSIVNQYLHDLMDGLTAKVFRTYNASKTLQEQLDEMTSEEMSLPEKILCYNRANRAVAVLCNHQRAIPKTFDKQMENLSKKLDEKKTAIKAAKTELKSAKQDCRDRNNSKNKTLLEKKKKTVERLEEQLMKLEVLATDKEENKQIALGTSKLNYLDPRISVAWCKKWEVPIEKIYNKTQRDKFRWACEMVGPEFSF